MAWRTVFWFSSLFIFGIVAFITYSWPPFIYSLVVLVPLFFIGVFDIFQSYSNILRNYPIIGHLRFMSEGIRPQIQQYFIESNQSGRPFNREERDLVYDRANQTIDTLPFGTQRDVNAPGFDWINHSMSPKVVPESEARIWIGSPQCPHPYHASRLNVSALSFGAISKNAVRALNRGAKLGGFVQNTGEGGLTQWHLEEGGDLVWQLGTGYFGCRDRAGNFDPKQFQEKAQLSQVKMIEIKISQGAKPSHGGILPAAKVTEEIANIRGVPLGEDCISPPAHSAFHSPEGLLDFIVTLRELSGGKPIGFKLCIGIKSEFLGICKAILKKNIYPDFITIDGSEGGTGAAPVEFSDYVGTPLSEGLVFAHNALVGIGVRQHIRLIASGKIISGFDMVCKAALGADLFNSARGMMFALGCVQARRCNTNKCPTGVTTQDPARVYSLVVKDKAERVFHFHDATVKSFLEVLGAVGVERVDQLKPKRVFHRVSEGNVKSYADIYDFLESSQLINGPIPEHYAKDWAHASAEHF